MKRFSSQVRNAAFLAAALALSGCVTDEDALDMPVIAAALPPAAARAENSAPRVPQDVAKNIGGLYEAPELERKVSSIILRLRRAANQPHLRYSAVILNSPAVNAFAMPDGQVFLTRGLLALANDEAELAAVIAHEMAHVEAQHTKARMEQASTALLASRVVMNVVGDTRAAQATLVANALSLASFSRAQEMSADESGIRMAAQAGYDPYGAARFLENLERAAALEKLNAQARGKSASSFFATHPLGTQRVAAAIYAARQWGARGIRDAGREDYLPLLDGMIYGEDPSRGTIIGRRFVHPQFGFTFTAPEGFALENTSSAVLGVGPHERALRFDSLALSAPLEDMLRAAASEDLKFDAPAHLKINGFEALTAIGHATGWTFRIVLIAQGETVYRFIFVAQDLSDAVDADFLRAAKSFHAIDADDAALTRPSRLRLVEAQNGDTPDTLASLMARPNPLETFLVLNGLSRDSIIAPGTKVKVVSGR